MKWPRSQAKTLAVGAPLRSVFFVSQEPMSYDTNVLRRTALRRCGYALQKHLAASRKSCHVGFFPTRQEERKRHIGKEKNEKRRKQTKRSGLRMDL